MGKSGAIIGLIGILIGVGGFAIGFIALSSVTTLQTDYDSFRRRNDAFYTSNDGPYTVSPATTVLEIPNLNVTFELNSPAYVYFSFTCHAIITSTSGTSSVWFFFSINGHDYSSQANRVGNFQGGSTEDYFSVNLQYFLKGMSPGNHSISVKVSSETTANVLTSMTLYVQILSP